MVKPHKGRISRVERIEIPDDLRELATSKYGPNLGFYFKCDFWDHPVFRGIEGFGGRTSLVVAYNESTGEVETLNSRYTVVPFRIDTELLTDDDEASRYPDFDK